MKIAAELVDDPKNYSRTMRVEPTGSYSYRVEITFVKPARRVVRVTSRPLVLPTGPGQLSQFMDVTPA
ncbi:MAG: hypothetical protein JST92_08230 [Deltaproteobacteria bacterium]|nr:hypothetical protein [Deltaproteobacteria bacterium]